MAYRDKNYIICLCRANKRYYMRGRFKKFSVQDVEKVISGKPLAHRKTDSRSGSPICDRRLGQFSCVRRMKGTEWISVLRREKLEKPCILSVLNQEWTCRNETTGAMQIMQHDVCMFPNFHFFSLHKIFCSFFITSFSFTYVLRMQLKQVKYPYQLHVLNVLHARVFLIW